MPLKISQRIFLMIVIEIAEGIKEESGFIITTTNTYIFMEYSHIIILLLSACE